MPDGTMSSVHTRGTSMDCRDDFMREPSATPMGTVDTIPTTKSSASSSHARASRTRLSTIMMPGMTVAMRPSSVVEANITILPTR